MYDIVAIGSATRDNFLQAEYELIDWPKAPSRKAIALPFGEKISVREVYGTIGGNAANASVTFARHGFTTACAAKIGDDLAGDELMARLKKEGVGTKLIARAQGKPTAYSALLLEGGERTILSFHGASDTFTLEDLSLSKLKSAWWYLSLAGDSYRMFNELIAFARDKKIKVAFNPSGYHLQHGREDIVKALPDLAFLVLNEGEAATLTGIPFEQEQKVFEALDKLVPGVVAITNGPAGVTVSDGHVIYRAGIFKEKEILDRTGAGDAFGSGFVAALMQKPDNIPYAIRCATANATSVVETIGATEGILTREQFEQDPRWAHLEITTTQI